MSFQKIESHILSQVNNLLKQLTIPESAILNYYFIRKDTNEETQKASLGGFRMQTFCVLCPWNQSMSLS